MKLDFMPMLVIFIEITSLLILTLILLWYGRLLQILASGMMRMMFAWILKRCMQAV